MRAETIQIIEITDSAGKVVEPAGLTQAEKVHRQLRPHLSADYSEKMQRVFLGGGRMAVAIREDEVVGVAVYRIYENTASGVHMYVDDLVTDETKRSGGVGKALLEHLQQLARGRGCERFTLDSGTQRVRAHQFYFREQMVVVAFHFVKPL